MHLCVWMFGGGSGGGFGALGTEESRAKGRGHRAGTYNSSVWPHLSFSPSSSSPPFSGAAVCMVEYNVVEDRNRTVAQVSADFLNSRFRCRLKPHYRTTLLPGSQLPGSPHCAVPIDAVCISVFVCTFYVLCAVCLMYHVCVFVCVF